MRTLVRCGVVLCLALLGSASVRGQMSLNLSQDLVALGIAPSNMVPNQPSLDAGPLFMAGVEYAKNHGIATVVADTGAYYFLSVTDNTHLALHGIDNMTIDLHGADLIFTHPLYHGLIVYYSTNAVIQNFTADYQPLPFTQVRVVAVDTVHAHIQYSVEPTWTDPAAFNSFSSYSGEPISQVTVRVFRSGRPVLGRLYSTLPLTGGGSLPIVNTDTGTSLAAVRPGDVVVVALNNFAEPVNTNHCDACTLRNITAFSSPALAVHAIHSQSILFERVYSIPKPGTDRLISSFGVATFPISGPNNRIRLSRAIRTLDDGFAMGPRIIGTVQSQNSSRRVTVNGSGGPSFIADGDTAPNGLPVTFQRPSDGVVLGSAVIVSQTASSGPFPYQVTFDLDRDLAATLAGAVMYTTDANQNGANSIIERNAVEDTAACCKGMYLNGLANSTVHGNYIRHTAFSGLFLVQGMTPGDAPTAPLTNMTVSNNVIDGTNMASNWWWFQFGGISSVTLTTAFDLMTGSVFSNLDITNNFIADPGRSGVWLGNTNGGSVTGNYVLHPNLRPDLANADPARIADATKPLVIDTTSSGITTFDNTIDTTSGVTFVTDQSSRELAAYAPGSAMRLNAYNLGALASPAATLTDADGVNWPIPIQSTSAHALDVQIPAGVALGGAYVTLTSGGTRYFGTLFLDSQDNIPAVNGCIYDVSPSSLSVPGTATTLTMLVVTPPGCGYQVSASDGWVTPGASGVGTGVISVGFAANTGGARSTTIEIAGQPFTITQAARPIGSDLSLDTPTSGAVATPFLIAGWALNRGAASGTGVDAIHLYLTPSGGPTTFLGVATYGTARADLAAIYGSQFMNSGFTFSASGLAPGTYTLSVFAHNAMTNTFDATRNVTFVVIRPVPNPHIAIDTPTPNQTVTSAFEVGGWLLDAGATIGTGVDDVKIYVQPPGAPAPGVFIGHGRLGLPRTDVGAIYGARFNSVGFHFTITGLSPSLGDTLWVIGHDTLTNADTISMSVPFNVDAKALMSIDVPSAESAIASNTFVVSGWAIDRAIEAVTAPGTGVDTIVLYAFHNPGSGEPAIFLGYADYGHISRPDVGDFYAPRYTPSGYVFTVDRAAAGLGTGEYNIVPIAHSTVTGTYNNLAIVRVILQ